MSATKPIVQPRTQNVTLALAKDEHAFVKGIAEELGISISAVMRNAMIASLMPAPNPTVEARQQHVTELAKVDRWRMGRSSAVTTPPAPPSM